jgi:hypothetical protein
MMSFSVILFPFLIYTAASFRFAPLPLIQRRSRFTANSFILNHSIDSYKQQLQFQKNVQKQGGFISDDLLSPPKECVSDTTSIIAKRDSLYSRIEETMKFAGFESPMHSSGKNTILILLLLYGIKIFRNKFLLKVCMIDNYVFILLMVLIWTLWMDNELNNLFSNLYISYPILGSIQTK